MEFFVTVGHLTATGLPQVSLYLVASFVLGVAMAVAFVSGDVSRQSDDRER